MTVWISVGFSHYGQLRGVEQFMQVYAGRRILHLIDLIAKEPGCRRLTVNEGRRSRARQRQYRKAYLDYLAGRGPYAPLAAALYFSRHDEVNHGNAADLGGPDGSAINAAEQAAIRKFANVVGILYTGPSFSPPELWHVEALTSPYSYTSTAAADKPRPVPTVTPAHQTSNGDDMFAAQVVKASTRGPLPKGAKFILDIREKTIKRIDTWPGATKAQLATARDEWNTLLTAQGGGKPINWTGDNAWAYFDGGYKRVNW